MTDSVDLDLESENYYFDVEGTPEPSEDDSPSENNSTEKSQTESDDGKDASSRTLLSLVVLLFTLLLL